MSVVGAFSRLQIGEGGAENSRFASKAPNALTFFLSDGFIEKVRLLVRPPKLPRNSVAYEGGAARRGMVLVLCPTGVR